MSTGQEAFQIKISQAGVVRTKLHPVIKDEKTNELADLVDKYGGRTVDVRDLIIDLHAFLEPRGWSDKHLTSFLEAFVPMPRRATLNGILARIKPQPADNH